MEDISRWVKGKRFERGRRDRVGGEEGKDREVGLGGMGDGDWVRRAGVSDGS